ATLVNLVLRNDDVNQGQITINDSLIQNLDLNDYRQKIGLVPQSASLFTGTLRDNLLMGKKDISDQDLWQALEIAQAKNFVAQNDQGLDMLVRQGGKNFSGGQKQRLTIARALVGQPQVLILDDSSSALDFATESKLRQALSKLNTTIIMISQRVSSVQQADQILVMNNGRSAGGCSHDELLATSGIYQASGCSHNEGKKGEYRMDKTTFLWLMNYIKRYRWTTIGLFLFSTITVLFQVLIPIQIGQAVNEIVGLDQVDFKVLWQAIIWLGMFALIAALAQYLQNQM